MGATGNEELMKNMEMQGVAAMKINEEKILVLVRLRPLSENETEKNEVSDWKCINEKTIVSQNNFQERSLPPITHTFDRVFDGDCSTRRIYEEGTKAIALSVISGINSSILAYGQTSSGKTYTMNGIMEYAVADIFDYLVKNEERAFLIKFSAMQIYNESVTDLLCSDNTPLKVRDNPEKGAYVENLTEEVLRDLEHLKELLSICKAQRRIGETSLNEASSRSHQIVRLTVESSARENLSKENSTALSASLNFVDLAGSERTSQALSSGDRLKEGSHINSSLFTLGNVIRKLSSKGRQGHVSYRDSKLTRILQPCLGGNARTAIVCTLSPARTHLEQSRNTLHFASCAKEVSTNAKVNIVMSDKALLKRLQSEVARLETKLRVPAVTFTCDCVVLQRDKDLQIEKLEMEVRELTIQRDLAESNVEHLQLLVKNYKTSKELGKKSDSIQWKDRCVEVHCSENKETSEDEASETSTLSISDDVATSTSMVHSYGNEAFESFSPCEEEATNLNLGNPLKVESYQSSRKLCERGDYPQLSDQDTEDEFSEDENPIFGTLSTKEDEGTSALMVHNDENEALDSTSSYEKEISKFRQQWARSESQVEKGKSVRWTDRYTEEDETSESVEEDDSTSILPVHSNTNNSFKLSYPIIEETSDISRFRNLTFSRSSRFRSSKDLTGGLPTLSARASIRNLNKRFPPRLDYGTGIAELSTQHLVSSFTNSIEKRTETQNINWAHIFVRVQKEILELWKLCNISLVHRTYFFLLFKGDPTDSIYMEIELRRLSLLNEAFSKSNHVVEGGQTLTLESSIEALGQERYMLSRLISKKFSRSQRDKLYEKWGINLETKQRKRQFVNLLWGDSNNLNHIADSADIVGKLIGFSANGASLKEMFGLSFAMSRSRRSFSWT